MNEAYIKAYALRNAFQPARAKLSEVKKFEYEVARQCVSVHVH